MFIRWYNPATSAWEDLSTAVDPAARTASARITHTSVFALFAENPPATAPVTPTPTSAPPSFLGFSLLWIAIAVIVVAVALIIIVIMRRRWSSKEEPWEEENWKKE
jgi:cytochrome oxidase assembly protein ShyY1